MKPCTMTLTKPRRPWWILVLGFVAWCALTFLAVLVPDEPDTGPEWEFLGQFLTLLASVALLGGGFVTFWQSREWTRQTQWLVRTLVYRSARELTSIAATLRSAIRVSAGLALESWGWPVDVLEPPLTEREREARGVVRPKDRVIRFQHANSGKPGYIRVSTKPGAVPSAGRREMTRLQSCDNSSWAIELVNADGMILMVLPSWLRTTLTSETGWS